MNIYIDESGTFVNAPSVGYWNAVAALAVPETGRKKIETLILQLRQSNINSPVKEIKLKDVPEDRYFQFLAEIERLNVVVFCTATDAGLNSKEQVDKHQQFQVNGVLKHIDKMKYEGGRQSVELVASQLKKLSPQLYVQLICQINLMYDVVNRSVMYFAQHSPSTLREFRWRVDQKNSLRPDFEEAFEKLSPALLQSRSIDEPMTMVKGFDYSYMSQYEYPNGKPPEYLKECYSIDANSGFNIGKIVRGNMKFMDSKDSHGIQAIDLVVSGIRRCLRGEFTNNELAAIHLGKLMLQSTHNRSSINLVSLGTEALLPKETANLVKLMSANSRRMLKHNS